MGRPSHLDASVTRRQPREAARGLRGGCAGVAQGSQGSQGVRGGAQSGAAPEIPKAAVILFAFVSEGQVLS